MKCVRGGDEFKNLKETTHPKNHGGLAGHHIPNFGYHLRDSKHGCEKGFKRIKNKLS